MSMAGEKGRWLLGTESLVLQPWIRGRADGGIVMKPFISSGKVVRNDSEGSRKALKCLKCDRLWVTWGEQYDLVCIRKIILVAVNIVAWRRENEIVRPVKEL